MSTYSLAEIAKHNNKENGVWIIVEGRVYDINNYLVDHPGGEDILIDGAGKDATSDFVNTGHSDDAKKLMEKYFIGTVEGTTSQTKSTVVPEKVVKVEAPKQQNSTSLFTLLIPVLLVIGAFIVYQKFT